MIEETIYQKMQMLKKEFYRIQSLNWVSAKAHGSGGAGQTLEALLNKERDHDILPDYHGIEFKTKYSMNYKNVALFSMALDNLPLRMQHLYDTYSWPSKTNPLYNVFLITCNSSISRCTRRHSFQLHVNYAKEVVELLVYDNYTGELVKDELSWSFKHLKLRLETKLSYLAYVDVDRMYDWFTHGAFFKYQDITFYKLIGFEKFLKLIEDGKIFVRFKLNYFKTGPLIGKLNDKGTSFEIPSENLKELFEEIPVTIDTN